MNESNVSSQFARPSPSFFPEPKAFSLKKVKGTPLRCPPPKAPVKSCPITRIFFPVTHNSPQPVSFKKTLKYSFISESPMYSCKKTASYFEQCYTIEQKLGCGSFGEVFKVRSKEDGKFYACKRTFLKYKCESDRQHRLKEVQKHEELPLHKNCLRFYRAWEEKQRLYLLTEVCQFSLAQYLNLNKISDNLLWNYCVDLLQGINHLHNNKLIHMDIKTDNIFIGLDGLCKLGDFGLVIDISKPVTREAVEGDPKYVAPECLNGIFTSKADIFSLGLVLLEMATDLELPRAGHSWQELRSGNLQLLNGHQFDLQPRLMSLLNLLLDPCPDNRPSAATVLSSSFMQWKTFTRSCMHKQNLIVNYLWDCAIFFWICFRFIFDFLNFIFVQHTPCKGNANNLEVTNITDGELDHSLAHPLADISSSDDNDSFCAPSIQPLYSTPICESTKKCSRIFTPCFSKSFHDKITITENDKWKQSPVTAKICDFSDCDELPDDVFVVKDKADTTSFGITSKNLINLFNSVQDEDSDD